MGGPRHRECQTRCGRHLQVHTHAERGSAAVIAVVAAAAARALAAAARALAAAEPWIAAGIERATSRGYSCEFFFFCVACLACSCLLLPFSVFASFLLRTHQNHLPPCEVFFYFCMPFFSVLALLFAPFCVFPPVLFGLIKTNPPGSFCLLVLFALFFPVLFSASGLVASIRAFLFRAPPPPFPIYRGPVSPHVRFQFFFLVFFSLTPSDVFLLISSCCQSPRVRTDLAVAEAWVHPPEEEAEVEAFR